MNHKYCTWVKITLHIQCTGTVKLKGQAVLILIISQKTVCNIYISKLQRMKLLLFCIKHVHFQQQRSSFNSVYLSTSDRKMKK